MGLKPVGKITVGSDGIVTKSGEAGLLFDMLLADAESLFQELEHPVPTGAASVNLKKSVARQAKVFAAYIHDAIGRSKS